MKKLNVILVLIALVEIVLVVNMIFTQGYFMNLENEIISGNKISDGKTPLDVAGEIIGKGINLLGGFLSIKQIGVVSADDVDAGCCPETNAGAICQDIIQGIPATSPTSCASPIATACSEVDNCKVGCCVDEEDGLCTPQATKQKCTDDNGSFFENAQCAISECVRGCCVLGDQVEYVNEQTCDSMSAAFGTEKDFRDYETELECQVLEKVFSYFTGACVFDEGDCSFMTETECADTSGKFFKDYLCSNPALNTSCEKQDHVGCAEDKEEVYWFDSCDNRENIYSSDKDVAWNSGMVLTKEESCNSATGNIESETCGNCARAESSSCSATGVGDKHVIDGDFVCKDLSCYYKDQWGRQITRQHGESWCEYDSFIGEGMDVAGSRHWRMSCVDGEIISEGCADGRVGICTQYDMDVDNKIFSTAACVANSGPNCLSYNGDDGPTTECYDNKDCMVKNIDAADYFQFSVCVPRYPTSSTSFCGVASLSSTAIWKKGADGNWGCEKNCGIIDPTSSGPENSRASKEFITQMNDLCISLGDCGSYVNINGVGSDNINALSNRASRVLKGKNFWTQFVNYKNPVLGQKVEPKDLREIMGYISGSETMEDIIGEAERDAKRMGQGIQLAGLISGSIGSLIILTGLAEGVGISVAAVKAAAALSAKAATELSIAASASTATAASGPIMTVLGAFAYVAIAFAIGAIMGYYIADWTGLQGESALLVTLGVGALAAGAVALYAAGQVAATSLAAVVLPFVGQILILAAIIMIAWGAITGWGDTKEVTVSFECKPWQAPAGEQDCDSCNNNPLKKCSSYRCGSLGQTCKLINAKSDNPTCQQIPRDFAAPILSPGFTKEGYEFTSVDTDKAKLQKLGGECISEFTKVNFTLNVSEFAQCIWSFERPELPTFEDMDGSDPVSGNGYLMNHSFEIMMPSISSLYAHNVTGDIRQMFANVNMYVRCQDVWKNYNVNEYVVNFCINSGDDLSPVDKNEIVASPKSGSYLKTGVAESNLTIWTNEPAECKYDKIAHPDGEEQYDSFPYNMACETDIFKQEANGWRCTTTLTNLSAGENDFYFRCKDQPWYIGTENESQRNANVQDWHYKISVSENALNISSINFKFNGKSSGDWQTIETGFEPISVDMEVITKGGSSDGDAQCSWGVWEDLTGMTFMRETNSYVHKQVLTPRLAGIHPNFVKCVDSAGNIANAQATFVVEADTDAPQVIRTYHDGGNLKIITDEGASCYFDFDRCNFDINNATSMTTGISQTHSSTWITGKEYHIKCKDVWGNTNPDCAIVAKAE